MEQNRAQTSKPDITTTDDIERLVDAFYDQALTDPVIGFFFTEVAQIDIREHLPKMYAFWTAILLGAPTYRRNAFLPHAKLAAKHPLEAQHFERWLGLFFATIDAHFEGPHADLAKRRAQQVATAMSAKLTAAAPCTAN